MQAELIVIYIFVFLYGIVIGSFSNVLICRVPLKENIATTRSHCMTCGAKIKWYDLVPLFSYIFLRGKCRNCGQKISMQYPLVEFINGCGYVWIFATNGINLLSVLCCLMFTILIVVSVIDWRTYTIPQCFINTIGVLGILRIIIDYAHLLDYLIGFCAIIAIMVVIDKIAVFAMKDKVVDGMAIGDGDIKLMAVAGLFLGWKNVIFAYLLGNILGAIIHSLVVMLILKKDHVLAFGPYLSAGIIIAMLYGERIINWYLSFFAI